MGLHITGNRADGEAIRYITAVRPQVVKFMSDSISPAVVAACKAVGSKMIWRHYVPESQQGEESHLAYLGVVQHAMQAPGLADFYAFEVDFNESNQTNPDGLARMSIAGMALATRMGKRAIIGSFSVGTPEPAFWPRYLDAIRIAKRDGHIVGFHEYGSGPLGHQYLANPNGDSYHCLRYRTAVREWKRMGVDSPDIVITEGGIDASHDYQTRGYKMADFTAEQYAKSWRWYCQEISLDPCVIGAVDFGFGNNYGDWDAFDLSRDERACVEMARVMSPLGGAPVPAPAPAPTPTPAPRPTPAPPTQKPVEAPSSSVAAGTGVFTLVRPGEGYWGLARRVKGKASKEDVAALISANIAEDLKPGQLIILPSEWFTVTPKNGGS